MDLPTSLPSSPPHPPKQRHHPPESLPHQATPRHPPQLQAHRQGVAQPHVQHQDVAQPHVQAQQPQAQGHLVAQAVAVSEPHADTSGDPLALPVLVL
ncbi:hypothetical protein A2U01_0061516 [Trifolium medium]|uniref:Uncharacterized protein n=1 Tax=Trifolium medium TaxID=97028 RepID=A0A392RUJ1_9FABA|nr:hypothetical protein [Trifolium medium]